MVGVPDSPLNLPVPIVFTVCQGIQQVVGGTFNVLSIFDRLTLPMLPDGTPPQSVRLQVLTVWTGGRGAFEQVLRVLDSDGREIFGGRTPYTLAGTSHRHYIVALIDLPAAPGVYTLTAGRPELELVRQDFTIELAQLPGSAP